MILFIFLSLQNIFATEQLADRIYNCAFKTAQAETYGKANNEYTMSEVVEACRQEEKALSIKIENAIISNNSLHHIKLSWLEEKEEKSRYYFFNIPNTKICNEKTVSENSLINNLRSIIDNDENSYGKNSCTESEFSKIMASRNKYGFGFKSKSKNGPCIRICPQGEVLQGIRANVLYTGDDGLSQTTAKNRLGEVFLDIRCVKCPYDYPARDMSYTKTSPDDNRCYNSDGCPDGTELALSNWTGGWDKSPVLNMLNPKKTCIMKCPDYTSRKDDGSCVRDRVKECELHKSWSKHPQEWLNRFLKASQSQKIGTCDMDMIRDLARVFTIKSKANLQSMIDASCYSKQSNTYHNIPYKFSEYLIKDPSSPSCILSARDNPKYDIIFYNLLSEHFYYQDPDVRFYSYEF